MSLLQEGLMDGIRTTSSLWDHIRIEKGTTPIMFRAIGNAEVNIQCREEDFPALIHLSMAKCAGRKVLDWMVNDSNGLQALLDLGGLYLTNAHPFKQEDLERHFANGVGHKATALMMNRGQYRALKAERREKDLPLGTDIFGKKIIINDWIVDAVWGLNLDNVHLWESEEGIHGTGEKTRQGAEIIEWDVSLGHKYGDDVTCMRVAS